MAKKTISQRIALDGGKAIESQLKDLGDAGEKAFDQIRKATLKADFAKFTGSLKTFGAELATVGKRVATAFAGVVTAGAAAGAGAVKLAKDSGEVVDGIGKAAEAAGLTVDAYGRLQFAAEMANVEQGDFDSGLARLNKTVGDAANGSKSALAPFQRLGVSIKDAKGRIRPTEDIIQDLAEAFSRMPAGAAKSALAIELFGRSGAKLLSFLNAGKKGLFDLGAQAEELGVVFTQQEAEVADALGDSLDEVKKATAGIRLHLGLIFAPAVTAAAEVLRDVIVENREAILSLGRALTLGTVRLVGDLVNALAGRDARVRSPWILTWRDAILEFGRDVMAVLENVVLPLFRAVRDGAKLVADGINAVFGTNISGGELLIGASLLKLLGVFKLLRSAVPVVVNGIKLIGSAFAFLAGGSALGGVTTLFRALIAGGATFLGLVGGLVGWPALIVAGVVAAGAAIFIFWDDIKAAAQSAFAYLSNLFSAENFANLLAGIGNAGELAGQLMVDAFKLAFQAIMAEFAALGSFIGGFVEGAAQEVARLAGELLPSWSSIEAAGSAVWTSITGAAQAAATGAMQAMAGLETALLPLWTSITTAATGVWTAFTGAASTAVSGLAGIVSSAFATASEAVGGLISAAVDAFTGATSEVAQAADEIGAAIQRATEASGDIEGAGQLADALVEPFRQASSQIDNVMSGIRVIVQNGFASITAAVRQVAADVQASINRILSALRQAAAAAAQLRSSASGGGSDGSNNAPGLAGGGSVRGAGTSISDSILAWLSNGEYVVNARATAQWLPFLQAINSFRLTKDQLRDHLKGFNLGGFVSGIRGSLDIAIPRYAGGGMIEKLALAPAAGGTQWPAGTTNVNLNIGGRDFALVGSMEVAAKLGREATRQGMNSTGRKPGWYK